MGCAQVIFDNRQILLEHVDIRMAHQLGEHINIHAPAQRVDGECTTAGMGAKVVDFHLAPQPLEYLRNT